MKATVVRSGILASLISAIAPLVAAQCSTQSDVEITFYGYPDNSPPGAAIAYDCGRGYTAGGENNPRKAFDLRT